MRILPSFVTDEKNLLGVCAALGHDFGFNPLYLRLTLAVLLLWNPVVVVGAYLFTGLAVAVSYWLFPEGGREHTADGAMLI